MNPSGGTTEPPEVTRARLNRLHLRRPVRRELRHEDVLRIARAWRWFADNERHPGEAGRLCDFLGWSEPELDAYERQHGVPLAPRHNPSGPAQARLIHW